MSRRLDSPTVEGIVWAALTMLLFTVCMAVSYRPSFESFGSGLQVVLPWLLVAGMVTAFLLPPHYGIQRSVALALGLTAWAILILDDDRWSIMTFAIYALCFAASSTRPMISIALAGLTSAVWAIAWIVQDAPVWTMVIPLGVFVVGSLLFLTIADSFRKNEEQATLITELRQAREALATSERAKGMLEERARMASEIHDTLAQGFTSIVLLSRAAARVGDPADALASIETTAQENLDAARRLVESIGPPELDIASLPDAINRHLDTALPADIDAQLRVVGQPRPLAGAIKITLLRAAQEALLNVRTHADAKQVDVTLSYLDDSVALDVRDDGVGFRPGDIRERGTLTGGQGLVVLGQRAQSLEGQLTIEANDGGGSVVSVLLPAGNA